MRLSEQFTLEWAAVNWERKVIQLDKTKNGSDRDIPMSKIVCDTLVGIGPKESGRVFPTEGVQFDQMGWFQTALDEANLKVVVWHTLRHTFCSWGVMAGVDIPTMQAWMGHKTITMTMRYTHLAPGHNNDLIERIAGGAPNTLRTPNRTPLLLEAKLELLDSP